MKSNNSNNLLSIKNDLFGGFTAAVVALPLALAFGVSSGAGALAGLWGAIILGFVASLFGGTRTQISGPTGPMTVVTASIIMLFVAKNPEQGLTLAFTTIMLGGCIQILFGYLKFGRLINYIPYTVISGFMTGIGLIIIILQLSSLLGVEHSPNSTLNALISLPELIAHTNINAFFLSVSLILLLFLWPAKLNQILPAPLLILLVGTFISNFFMQQKGIPLVGKVPTGFPTIQIPQFDFVMLPAMLKYGFILGLLGSIDSLLTSVVADNMTHTEHDSDKELKGQGLGNLIAGLFGGLPGAGATMRTVVNIRAGGTSPVSGIIHALLLFLVAMGGGALVEIIPNAVLAAILFKVGFDIIDWTFLFRLRKADKSSIVIVTTTVILTVFVDLISAVGVGTILACLYTIQRLTKQQLDAAKILNLTESKDYLSNQQKEVLDKMGDRVLLYHLKGIFSFSAAKGLTQKLKFHDAHEILILDLLDVPLIDTTTALTFEEIVLTTLKTGRKVIVICADNEVLRTLKKLGVVPRLNKSHFTGSRKQAIDIAAKLLGAI